VPITVGVLALQGAFAAHAQAFHRLGADTVFVRTPSDLLAANALVMPGGESTTMSKLLSTSQLFEPILELLGNGFPVFGTCAGMILLANTVLDGRPDQRSFQAIDITVRRNGYGRQVDSFEADLEVQDFDSPLHAVFIRAPRVEHVGPTVEVLAEYEGVPVFAREHSVFVASFHPELTNDDRVHSRFLQEVA
jgi:pyridoxal 5'-phosphate synthase pdxT subunit